MDLSAVCVTDVCVWAQNVVYSTQKGSASPVLMKTYRGFLWKYDKTWIKGSLIQNPTPPKKQMQELKLKATGRDTAQSFCSTARDHKAYQNGYS